MNRHTLVRDYGYYLISIVLGFILADVIVRLIGRGHDPAPLFLNKAVWAMVLNVPVTLVWRWCERRKII